MVRGRIPRIRLPRRTAFVAVFSTLFLAATGTAAHAKGWGLQDGFEDNPEATWTIQTYGSSFGSFENNAGTAHSGNNYVWLSAGTDFAAVGRPVHIPDLASPSCSASVYLETVYAGQVNVEIINPATWTYMASNQVTLSPGGYQQIFVGTFYPDPSDVYVRVSVLGTGTGNWSGVRVDDLQVSCVIIA
jgi:hypothetical protein